jgi:dTDP-glucose 4,6-dehydratase
VRLTIATVRHLLEKKPEYMQSLKAEANIEEWMNDDLITYVKDRLGHDQRYAIDPTKITKELGWYPETKFEDGIIKTIRWYLENREWVNEVTSGDYQKYYQEMYGNR